MWRILQQGSSMALIFPVEQSQAQTKINCNGTHGYALKKTIKKNAMWVLPNVKDSIKDLFNAAEVSWKNPSQYKVWKQIRRDIDLQG